MKSTHSPKSPVSRASTRHLPLAMSGLFLAVLSGCTGPATPVAKGPAEHSFVSYRPRPAGNSQLRLAVKDLIDMRGVVTTAGSEYLAKHGTPAKRDAECMRLARERNVWIVGRTNMSEFAATSSGINGYYGTPRSSLTHKHKLIPGGSSSGAAVAVATGLADVAFGSDTGGSVRIPAANCGVYGLKTTYGLVSLKGVFPMSPKNLDTIGPLAKDLPNLVTGMDLLEEGFAGKYRQAVTESRSPRQIRVGRLYVDGTNAEIEEAVDASLRRTGFKVVKLNDGFKKQWEQAQKDGMSVAIADAWYSDREYMNKRGVTSMTKAALLLGEIEYKTRYKDALKRRTAWQRTLRHTFDNVDFIVMPTMKSEPPKIPFFGSSALFEATAFGRQNTVAMNLSGSPAVAIPVPLLGEREKGQVQLTSMQIVGPHRSEAELLNMARLVESKTPRRRVIPQSQAPTSYRLLSNAKPVAKSKTLTQSNSKPTSNSATQVKTQTKAPTTLASRTNPS